MYHYKYGNFDTLNSIHLQLIFTGRATVDPQWQGENAVATYSRLYYIVSGEALIETETSTLCLQPGNWYLLPAGCQFSYRCPKKMDHVYCHLKLCGANGFDLLQCCGQPCSISAAELPGDSFLTQPENTLFGSILLRQNLYAIITAILQANNIPLRQTTFSPCVEQAIVYINANLHAKLTLSQVAEKAFVSRSTLTKHFRRELGTSVNAYIMDALLSQARQQVISTTLPIRTISENLGFTDQFYFSKCFKAKFGLPPQKYRQQPFV